MNFGYKKFLLSFKKSEIKNTSSAISVYRGATIPNHVDGSKNHLESLLESGNQVEFLESRITFIIGYLVFSVYYESCDAPALI